ncbi:MAG: RNA polymerase sigma factor [Chloroflexia bacterium]|nr:RNA polymerase sigma factor [Chloroflexia bacterium]
MEQRLLSELILKCKSGDKEAFRPIMQEYADYLFTLAFRLLRNDEEAKDIVQETFIKVWQNINSYKKEVKLTTWMYKICINLCFDKLKSKKRKPLVYEENFENIYKSIASESLIESLDNKQLAMVIEQLAEGLTPKQQLVFVLKDIQGLESDEIEEITGLEKGQVKSNLYYARKEIRNKLIKIGYEV